MKALFIALQIITFLDWGMAAGENAKESVSNITYLDSETKNLVTTTTEEKIDTTHLQRIGPNVHPQYTYSCNEDLTVTFRGVQGTIEYYGSNGVPINCTIKAQEGHYGNFHISNECMEIEKGKTEFNNTRTVSIKVFDESENDFNPHNSSIISGGFHRYKLTCLALPNNGVERVAFAETGIKDIDELTEYNNEIGNVEMRFKNKDDDTAQDVSQVFVGDIFFMYLEYIGSTKSYTLLPQECFANKGPYRQKVAQQFIQLWGQNEANRTKNSQVFKCVSDEARQYKVMENFQRHSSTQLHTKLHGFRFANSPDGSSDDVTITCTVRICATLSSVSCTDNCAITNAPHRRKRETNQSHLRTATRTIRVAEPPTSSDTGRISLNLNISLGLLLMHICKLLMLKT